MQPLVKQHLESLRRTLLQVIVPELSSNAFAAEQAGLIAASLALLAEVQPYEDDYLRQERSDLMAALTILGMSARDDELLDRDSLASSVQALKQRFCEGLERAADANNGRMHPETLARLAPLLDRQLAREASWVRLTGFVPDGGSLPTIRDLLARQRDQTSR